LKKPLFRLNSILVQVSVGVAAIVAGMALGAFFLRHPNSTEFQPNEMADAQREAPKVGLGPKKDASEEPKPGRQGTSDSRPVRLKRVPAPQEPLSVEPATVRFSGPSQAREIARNVDQAGITSPPSSPATSGGIDTGTDGGDRPGKSSVGGPGEGGGIPGDVFRVGGDVSPPSVLYRVEPAYSDKARRALFLGAVVVISAIVRRDGSIEIRRVVRGLGTELDESAIQALGQWKFRPAMKNGVPVDVLVNIELSFR
jgi:TonB family protein